MRRVGTIFSPYVNAPERLREAVDAAEASGVAELWIWEDCFRHSAFAVASAALAWTDRLRIGIGISPMPLRNVAVTAMEIATIERLFPGRLLPGVGHGVQSWMGQVGARVASPLTLLREYVPALRDLLAGEQVTVGGRYVTLDGVRLDWPPERAPLVYAAAEGPKTLHTTGGVADGVVLDSRHTLAELSRSIDRVRAGRQEAGRTGDADIVAYVVTAFGTDARARAVASLDDSVYGGLDSDDSADRVLAGSVEEVAAGVERLFDIGVEDVVLQPTADAEIEAFSASVGEVARLVGQ
ncbi:N5,N10-methylene tetrahydromethanopterin reductase [Microbacterium mangrovi]|uniref:N5,N10-methylene tetrahydromethanopterin reductase n=1 Tax=Microbacterium mangrovi TaxID=1348253 RepID=A0A0B2AAY0_9MICO|nr:LLM class flavin-dependent oxidoreductase [Microbacterium mangrovi]KHK98732.1 N5,N10-methylene tetrahydromethanopterin reductase [Microbacterium mangrovi]